MNLMAINQATTLTMSSREIAELTGKRHDHVMRDIKAMLDSLGGVPSFGDTYRNEQNGQEYPIFRLDKEHTLCLVSGYNVKMRMAIIQRWQALEEQKHATSPMAIASTMNSAQLGLLMQQVEAKEEAIRTKAMIGSKREATCMARVAHSNREAAAAKAERDEAIRKLADADVTEDSHLDWAIARLTELKGSRA
ncbi:Rha family transcriptional regulator [Aeromonas sanarellii]|uniref:Rha family transcriptional regulator n=1 Tax=Aeromonas sanarellii TaxID=633415 RepID=UPI003B9FA0A2